MNAEAPKGRVVEFGTSIEPRIEETKEDLLERLLMQANLLGPANNQNGTGLRNPDKEVRRKRREQKLARRRNRER